MNGAIHSMPGRSHATVIKIPINQAVSALLSFRRQLSVSVDAQPKSSFDPLLCGHAHTISQTPLQHLRDGRKTRIEKRRNLMHGRRTVQNADCTAVPFPPVRQCYSAAEYQYEHRYINIFRFEDLPASLSMASGAVQLEANGGAGRSLVRCSTKRHC